MRDLSSPMRMAILRNARRSVSKVALRQSERRGAAWRSRCNTGRREAPRWAVLKAADGKLTTKQAVAPAELEATDLFTAKAWWIKEKLRRIRNTKTVQAARWRITVFIRRP